MEEQTKEKERFGNLKRVYRKMVLIFNLLVLGFYTTFTLINISNDFESWHTKVMIVFLLLHIAITLLISFLKYFGNKKYLSKLKDSVIVVGILKKGITLLNLAMGVVTLLSSFIMGEEASTYSLVVMATSIALTILQILFSIFKMWFKKYMARKVEDIKIRTTDFKNNVKSKFSFLRRKTESEEVEIEKEDI